MILRNYRKKLGIWISEELFEKIDRFRRDRFGFNVSEFIRNKLEELMRSEGY